MSGRCVLSAGNMSRCVFGAAALTLGLLSVHAMSARDANLEMVGRQLRQHDFARARSGSLPQQHSGLLEALRAAAGADITWDFNKPIGTPSVQAGGDDGCSWSTFAPQGARVNGTICLRPGADLLADKVRSKLFWPECADLPAMLAAAPVQMPSSAGPPIMLDVGANIGACSLHMLMMTNATVISFEPGQDNAFFASRSLLRLSGKDGSGVGGVVPDAEKRLLFVRSALGAGDGEQLLHQAVGNAGHAMIGKVSSQFAPKGHVAAQRIVIRRMDDLLWPASARIAGVAPPSIALLKIDVEG